MSPSARGTELRELPRQPLEAGVDYRVVVGQQHLEQSKRLLPVALQERIGTLDLGRVERAQQQSGYDAENEHGRFSARAPARPLREDQQGLRLGGLQVRRHIFQWLGGRTRLATRLAAALEVVDDFAERVVLVGAEERCRGDGRAHGARRWAGAALTREEQPAHEQLSDPAPHLHSDDRLYGDVGTSYPAPNVFAERARPEGKKQDVGGEGTKQDEKDQQDLGESRIGL